MPLFNFKLFQVEEYILDLHENYETVACCKQLASNLIFVFFFCTCLAYVKFIIMWINEIKQITYQFFEFHFQWQSNWLSIETYSTNNTDKIWPWLNSCFLNVLRLLLSLPFLDILCLNLVFTILSFAFSALTSVCFIFSSFFSKNVFVFFSSSDAFKSVNLTEFDGCKICSLKLTNKNCIYKYGR